MPPGERCGKGVLVDGVMGGQDQVDRAGHLGVVGPLPGNWRKRPAGEMVTVGGDEELGSERIAKGEPEKGLPGALKTVTGHLPLIFAGRRPARRLVRAVAGHWKGALPHPRG